MKSFFQKLKTILKKVSQNKCANFVIGFLVFLLIYRGLAPLFPCNHCVAKGIALFIVLLTGYIKEYVIKEKWFKYKIDHIDAYLVDLGGLVGLIVTALLNS